MKFLCDRCKTRYSIGDDRVRGKILKIRCKNCANVITVREGMTADPDGSLAPPEYSGRAKKPTMAAPAELDERSEGAKDRGGVQGPAPEPLGTAKQPPSAASGPGATSDPGARQQPGLLRQPQGTANPSPGAATEPLGAAKQKLGAATEPLGAKQRLGAATASPVSQGPATEPLGAAKRSASAAKAPADASKEAAAAAKAPAGAAKQPGASKDKPVPGAGQARRSSATDDPGRGHAGAAKRPAGQEFLRGEPVNALGAAFASAMAKPPPALEEEWYVSIDGDQSGPFSLADAQGWVAGQAFDAELHCWSEGFDDWLPVDKVSHFRGLRKRAAAAPATAPPAVPRVAGVPPRPAGSAPPVELEGNEPRPRFAAARASLERGAPAPASPGTPLPAARVPVPASAPASTRAAFGTAVPPRTNGAAVAPVQRKTPDDKPGTPLGPAYGRMIEDPFGEHDLGELGDSATQIEQLPFSDEPGAVSATAGPVVRPAQRPGSGDAALASPPLGAGPRSAMPSPAEPGDFGDGELSIGEVSRVVKLADLVRQHDTEQAGLGKRTSGPVIRTSSVIPRMVGQNPRLRSTGGASSMADPGATPGDGDLGTAMAPVGKPHRGLIALLGVAVVVVLGVVGAVVLFVTNDDAPTEGNLGRVQGIDTSRPEDPTAHRPSNPVGSAGSANPAPPSSFVPRPPRRANPSGGNRDAEAMPAADSLRSEEIEDIARRNQDMTQRCYMRSQRGADSILVGDVKKIAVTLTIDKDGHVNDVQLSDHGGDNLGKCLSGSIKAWKFRQSSGGTFKFSLNFVSP